MYTHPGRHVLVSLICYLSAICGPRRSQTCTCTTSMHVRPVRFSAATSSQTEPRATDHIHTQHSLGAPFTYFFLLSLLPSLSLLAPPSSDARIFFSPPPRGATWTVLLSPRRDLEMTASERREKTEAAEEVARRGATQRPAVRDPPPPPPSGPQEGGTTARKQDITTRRLSYSEGGVRVRYVRGGM